MYQVTFAFGLHFIDSRKQHSSHHTLKVQFLMNLLILNIILKIHSIIFQTPLVLTAFCDIITQKLSAKTKINLTHLKTLFYRLPPNRWPISVVFWSSKRSLRSINV